MAKAFEAKKGNIPLIITVPHGGALVPQDIPNRDFGSYKKDRETILVLKEILYEFSLQKYAPYYIHMNLHRRKIDVNRGSKEGAQTKEMLKTYKEYHNTIRKMRLEMQEKFGAGMLIDLHGQKSKKGFIEIGYGLNKEELVRGSRDNADVLYKKSSIGYLLNNGQHASEIVFGAESLGDCFLKYYKVYPSSRYQEISDPHFNGVYTLQRHVVKRKKEKMFGANLELCYFGIRDCSKNRKRFARIFCKAIMGYLDKNIKK